MIRAKLSPRRPLAILGAAVVGIAATLAVAAPASAHYSVPSGSAVCDTETGEWVVTWKVKSEWHFDATTFSLHYTKVLPEGTTLVGIDKKTSYPVDAEAVGTQRVPATATHADLHVKATWNDGFKETELRKSKVWFQGTCEKETPPTTPAPSPTPTEQPTTPPAKESKPTASASSACDGTVLLTISNGEDATADAVLTVKAKDFNKTYTLAPGAKKDDIVVPAGAGTITVTEGDKAVGEPFNWVEPENCVEPGEPVGSYDSTCDELIFMISNPEDGETVTVTFTPNKGEPKTLTVEPGKTGTVKFPAEEGLTVTPSAEGMEETEPIAWEKPENCGGDGGGLPVTGAAAGGIAAGAAVLLIAGIVLFMVNRRRKLTFTA